jgi:2-polyprenyl-3-methyl-5-hydroxy-6-metoxy-1,4-benzoquinol methylase
MASSVITSWPDASARARLSGGISNIAIYTMVRKALEKRHVQSEIFVDVGCGVGNLWPFVSDLFSRYVGADVVQYEGFPKKAQFVCVDLDSMAIALPEASADVVAAVETIEHLENPRAFVRELVRLVKPGGWVIFTTPNQLSLLSLCTLAVKGRFSAFQDVHYPAHRTALLEIDLKRIASECGLERVDLLYSEEGRMVFTARHYPRHLSKLFPRWFSDNVLLIGRTPSGRDEARS